ncbi:MAG: Phosphoribosylformylglycinamidine synthase subunit PurQ [Fimbriimonadaceae bacterium]|nr:Phosphoribosylformylglycinamidine synthase subunit PurQ [Fimbriimonadaceae bacterium]
MRVAVIRFPGSNCDQDALYALRDDLGLQADYVWHEDHDLSRFDAVFLPGGFTYGDYLRCGAIASRAPIMDEVRRLAARGNPVIGVCNGFQVLCESEILPGALMQNASRKFVCKTVTLRAENRTSVWTDRVDRLIQIPIAHGEGRFIAEEPVLRRLEDEQRVAFRYVDAEGQPTDGANPNGSMHNIAGILNEAGNVLGIMPHPERATREALGKSDGRLILNALRVVRV